MSLKTQILPSYSLENQPHLEDTYLIDGLFMESCRWDLDSMELADPLPNGQCEPMAIIQISACETYPINPDIYLMPIYKTSARKGTLGSTGNSNNHILSIECPSSKEPRYWILKGSALLCQPEY